MQIKDLQAGYKQSEIIEYYFSVIVVVYVVIQSLSVGLLYVEEETVHSVHRFTMF